MLIVADSSALIALATCDGLGAFLTNRVVKVDTTRWVLTAGGLGRGEIEAMALYKQLTADALLIDDRPSRSSDRGTQPDQMHRCAWSAAHRKTRGKDCRNNSLYSKTA